MVNILQFPGAAKADFNNETAFGDVKALFADDSAMVFSSDSSIPMMKLRPSAASSLKGDWTNQELADLYRVEAILVQAGVKLETDRGVTDEDDPWFVFCRPDGEVFVHLARTDGRYLLDSPGMGAPVYGDDFGTLVDIFVRNQMEKAPSGNVVRFRPGSSQNGVVRLHPAMMMAALIWTLYLAADSMTSAAHAAETDGASADHHNDGASFWRVGSASSAVGVTEAHKDTQGSAPLGARDESAGKAGAIDGRVSHMGLSQPGSSVAAGLAAIAVSWGLYDPNFLDLNGLGPIETSRGNHGQEGSAKYSSETTVSATASSTFEAQFSGEKSHNEKHEPAVQVAQQKNVPAANTITQEVDNSSSRHVEDKMSLSIHDASVPAAVNSSNGESAQSSFLQNVRANEVASGDVQPAISSGSDKQASSIADVQSLLKLASSVLGDSQKYKIGDYSIIATFDVAELKEVVAEILAVSPTPATLNTSMLGRENSVSVVEQKPASATNPPHLDTKTPVPNYIPSYFASYDQAAKDFVYNFLTKTASVEMIKVGNSIIFVDTTAIDEKTDVAAVRSWVLDSNTTVSTIGHADYFIKYDLV